MSKNKKGKDALNLTKSGKEELIKLREENKFLKASLEYKKPKSLNPRKRAQKQGKNKSNFRIKVKIPFNQIENIA